VCTDAARVFCVLLSVVWLGIIAYCVLLGVLIWQNFRTRRTRRPRRPPPERDAD